MADPNHVEILKQGIAVWNQWRADNPHIKPDLSNASLSQVVLSFFDHHQPGIDFQGVNLRGANMSKANMYKADLSRAHLNNANLQEANLHSANLSNASCFEARLGWATLGKANLSQANLGDAELYKADLSLADLTDAILNGADLRQACLIEAKLCRTDLVNSVLVDANLEGATLEACEVFGVSAWRVNLARAKQSNLMITYPYGDNAEPAITVDNLEVAQFIYLLLHNEKIRDVIDEVTSRAVLILGRFTPKRKLVLDAVKKKLQSLGLLPIMFDFAGSQQRDFTETIMTLASMSLFVIADITNPKATPLELQATVPNYMVPFAPIIEEGQKPFSMFKDLHHKYHWVLNPIVYDTYENLVACLEAAIVEPALAKHDELRMKRAAPMSVKHVRDIMHAKSNASLSENG
ncbi:MAG TPA: pentapeptide repeat-containing protein [Nitrospira sp.]|nr:pentapeptide repeat-containing protein [Nitrospira sp.]